MVDKLNDNEEVQLRQIYNNLIKQSGKDKFTIEMFLGTLRDLSSKLGITQQVADTFQDNIEFQNPDNITFEQFSKTIVNMKSQMIRQQEQQQEKQSQLLVNNSLINKENDNGNQQKKKYVQQDYLIQDSSHQFEEDKQKNQEQQQDKGEEDNGGGSDDNIKRQQQDKGDEDQEEEEYEYEEYEEGEGQDQDWEWEEYEEDTKVQKSQIFNNPQTQCNIEQLQQSEDILQNQQQEHSKQNNKNQIESQIQLSQQINLSNPSTKQESSSININDSEKKSNENPEKQVKIQQIHSLQKDEQISEEQQMNKKQEQISITQQVNDNEKKEQQCQQDKYQSNNNNINNQNSDTIINEEQLDYFRSTSEQQLDEDNKIVIVSQINSQQNILPIDNNQQNQEDQLLQNTTEYSIIEQDQNEQQLQHQIDLDINKKTENLQDNNQQQDKKENKTQIIENQPQTKIKHVKNMEQIKSTVRQVQVPKKKDLVVKTNEIKENSKIKKPLKKMNKIVKQQPQQDNNAIINTNNALIQPTTLIQQIIIQSNRQCNQPPIDKHNKYYTLNRLKLSKYFIKNNIAIQTLFKEKQNKCIDKNELFSFIQQNLLNIEQIQFQIETQTFQNIFGANENEQQVFQPLINNFVEHFKIADDIASFTFDDIKDLLEFMLRTNNNLHIIYPNYDQEKKKLLQQQPIQDESPIINSQKQQLKNKNLQVNQNLIAQLNDTIEKYELILKNESKNEVERKVISSTLDSLKQQLTKLQSAKQSKDSQTFTQEVSNLPININHLAAAGSASNRHLTRQQMLTIVSEKPDNQEKDQEMIDRRKQNLQEVYNFFCKLSYQKTTTFETIQHESNVLDMQKFVNFCKAFNLTKFIRSNEIVEIYNRSSKTHKDASFDEFLLMLQKIADLIIIDKEGKIKSSEEKIEDLYKYIGIDDPSKFKPKIVTNYRDFSNNNNNKKIDSVNGQKNTTIIQQSQLNNNNNKIKVKDLQQGFNKQDDEKEECQNQTNQYQNNQGNINLKQESNQNAKEQLTINQSENIQQQLDSQIQNLTFGPIQSQKSLILSNNSQNNSNKIENYQVISQHNNNHDYYKPNTHPPILYQNHIKNDQKQNYKQLLIKKNPNNIVNWNKLDQINVQADILKTEDLIGYGMQEGADTVEDELSNQQIQNQLIQQQLDQQKYQLLNQHQNNQLQQQQGFIQQEIQQNIIPKNIIKYNSAQNIMNDDFLVKQIKPNLSNQGQKIQYIRHYSPQHQMQYQQKFQLQLQQKQINIPYSLSPNNQQYQLQQQNLPYTQINNQIIQQNSQIMNNLPVVNQKDKNTVFVRGQGIIQGNKSPLRNISPPKEMYNMGINLQERARQIEQVENAKRQEYMNMIVGMQEKRVNKINTKY